MGKATRWLKGLLGMKKEKEKDHFSENSNSISSDTKKNKERWSFAKSGRDTTTGSTQPEVALSVNNLISDNAWLRSYIADSEKEHNKHAIAVAAATAATADAAVAAAQAAMAVVRLTSQGRAAFFGGGRERCAAVKIQTVFRGFLARKALRALKGLVKLQAVVRGYLVRKRTAATLRSMLALIRAQNAVRSRRARRPFNQENRFIPDTRHRKFPENFDETRSEFHSKRLPTSYETNINSFEGSPKIVEIDTYKPRLRSRRFTSALSECNEDMPYQTISSPLPCPVSSLGHIQDYEWCFIGNECKFPTAQNTPRFANSFRANCPNTPAKSVCGGTYFHACSNYPNYMANTQSFMAKLRSQSAPKQRPEDEHKKRLSLNKITAARNSISGVRMQRSCYQVEEQVFDL